MGQLPGEIRIPCITTPLKPSIQHFLVPTLLRNNTSTANTCGMIMIWKLFATLVWYNNRELVPFLKAIDKMSDFWKKRRIDIFKDGVSVPGLTMKYLFSNVPNIYLLFTEKDKDLFYTKKYNNVGGPSNIFNRYHEKDKTVIRNAEMIRKNTEPRPCKKVVGYDANGTVYMTTGK